MKKVINAVFSIIILSVFALHANAQKGEWKLNLNYNYSFPLGSFKNDIINNASPRGFSGDFMYDINNKFAVGLHGAYQDYYQKYPRAVYQTDNHEVTSAVLSNSIQTMPILLKASFSPLGATHAPIKPYIAWVQVTVLLISPNTLGSLAELQQMVASRQWAVQVSKFLLEDSGTQG